MDHFQMYEEEIRSYYSTPFYQADFHSQTILQYEVHSLLFADISSLVVQVNITVFDVTVDIVVHQVLLTLSLLDPVERIG
jgi:hypothetical protein